VMTGIKVRMISHDDGRHTPSLQSARIGNGKEERLWNGKLLRDPNL
jgi:hypothetical protein